MSSTKNLFNFLASPVVIFRAECIKRQHSRVSLLERNSLVLGSSNRFSVGNFVFQCYLSYKTYKMFKINDL